jgi:hypothetical protein
MKNLINYLPLIIIMALAFAMFFVAKKNAVRLNQ